MLRPESLQLSQTATAVQISFILAQLTHSTLTEDQVDVDVQDCQVVFSANPYFVKFKFNQPLMDQGAEHKFEAKGNQEYLLQLGKLNYK